MVKKFAVTALWSLAVSAALSIVNLIYTDMDLNRSGSIVSMPRIDQIWFVPVSLFIIVTAAVIVFRTTIKRTGKLVIPLLCILAFFSRWFILERLLTGGSDFDFVRTSIVANYIKFYDVVGFAILWVLFCFVFYIQFYVVSLPARKRPR